jgi:hypothetical protein
MNSRRWQTVLVAIIACFAITSCAPIAWLVRGALGRAALTRAATVQGVTTVAASSVFARTAVGSGLSLTETLAIRGATTSLLRNSPLRLSAARSIPVVVYDGENLLLRGTLERQGRWAILKDDGGGSVRVEAQGDTRAKLWDAAGELAGEAALNAAGSTLTAANGVSLGRDVLGNNGEITHFDADGQLLGRSTIRLGRGQPQLRLDLGPNMAKGLRADLQQELSAFRQGAQPTDEPPPRRLELETLFVGGNLATSVLPLLNGFNAEADQRFVTSIMQNGGPSWATHRGLLRISALAVDGDCRRAQSLPQAKVCAVAIGFRAPLRPSFHLRDECPGASETQALDTCLERMRDEMTSRLQQAIRKGSLVERVEGDA